MDNTAPTIVSLLAVGMALAFILADRSARTSQAQALFLAFVGIAIALSVMVVQPLRAAYGVLAWEGLLALPEVLAFVFAYEWVLRVRQTIPAGNLNTRGADRLLRAAQGLAVFYGLAAVTFPRLRAEHFDNFSMSPDDLTHAGFWLFSIPLGLSLLLGVAATLFTLNRRPDRAEARRLVTFALSAPIMGMTLDTTTVHATGRHRRLARSARWLGAIPCHPGQTGTVSVAFSGAPGCGVGDPAWAAQRDRGKNTGALGGKL